MICRFCRTPLRAVFCDLGVTAVSNAFLTADQLDQGESVFPLAAYCCEACHLVQVGETRRREDLFSPSYVYASSISKGWLDHCRRNVEALIPRFGLGPSSRVLEVASNDGYLLQYFRDAGVPCLGVEPTASTAALARQKGIETIVDFFDEKLAARLAAEGRQADLILGNNVLAHVPDLNGFVGGFPLVLRPGGALVMEFPHLAELIENAQFDTIYHEHYSYFSLHVVETVFARHGLALFDAQTLPTHGGSLRIFAAHVAEAARRGESAGLREVRAREQEMGLDRPEGSAWLRDFQGRTERLKYDLLKYLIDARERGLVVAGFGAAAKGNTFLNYAGVKSDLLSFVADDTPFKQGRFLPQSRIPVVSAEELRARRPDRILILPWNFREEIIRRLAFAGEWGARFVTAVPRLQEWPASD